MPDFKHFFLTNTATSEKYTATGGGSGTFRSPPRDSREGHGKKLVEGLEKAREEAAAREQAAEFVDFCENKLRGKQPRGGNNRTN